MNLLGNQGFWDSPGEMARRRRVRCWTYSTNVWTKPPPPGPRTNTAASSFPFYLFQLFCSFSFIIIIFGLYVCTQEVTSGRGWDHILSKVASFPVIVLRPTWGPIHLMSHKAMRTIVRGASRLTSCSRSSHSRWNHTSVWWLTRG